MIKDRNESIQMHSNAPWMLLAREYKSAERMEDTQNIHIDAIPDSNRDRGRGDRPGETGRGSGAIGHARTVGERGGK